MNFSAFQIACISLPLATGLIYICWTLMADNNEEREISRRDRIWHKDERVSVLKSHNETKKMESFLLFKKHNFIDNKIVDALWTSKPHIFDNSTISEVNNENPQTKDSTKEKLIDTKHEYTIKDLQTKSVTTQTYTEAVTNPIITVSVTTPLTTETVTSPITTMSVTTPLTTEAGYREATTEAIQADDEPNETIRLIRRKRGGGNSPTTPDPDSTTTAQPACCSRVCYRGKNRPCMCPRKWDPVKCEKIPENQAKDAEQFLVEVEAPMVTNIPNTDENRSKMQMQLEAAYFGKIEGLQAIFVDHLKDENGESVLKYELQFSKLVNPKLLEQASAATIDIIQESLKINIDNQAVAFSKQNATLIAPHISTDPVPVPANIDTNVCYTYNFIQACKNGGTCRSIGGSPTCICASDQFYGEYCELKKLYADETDETALAVLFPVASGLGFLVLCGCLICVLLRRGRGDHEDTPSVISVRESEEVPAMAFAVPKLYLVRENWPSFSREPVPEVDYSEPSIYREPIYRYHIQDGSGSYSTSSDSMRDNNRWARSDLSSVSDFQPRNFRQLTYK